MLIVLFGPDEYRREGRRRALVEEYARKFSIAEPGRYDLSFAEEQNRWEEFMAHTSLFEEKKIAVISGFEDAHNESRAKAIMKTALESKKTFLIVTLQKKPTIAFLTREPAQIETFSYLEGKTWEKFIVSEAKSRGIELEAEALELLSTVFQKDTWRMITELEKLSLLKKKKIAVADLSEDVKEKTDFWPIVNSLRSPELAKRLAALEELFLEKEPGAKIFNILAARPGKDVAWLARYDFAVKSGKLDYEEVLLDLAIK